MAVYHYKAASPEGEVTEGDMEAQSRDVVIECLQALGYVPIRAEERGEAKEEAARCQASAEDSGLRLRC